MPQRRYMMAQRRNTPTRGASWTLEGTQERPIRREAFGADFKRLDDSTPTTWDAGKGRLDKAWTELESAVDDA